MWPFDRSFLGLRRSTMIPNLEHSSVKIPWKIGNICTGIPIIEVRTLSLCPHVVVKGRTWLHGGVHVIHFVFVRIFIRKKAWCQEMTPSSEKGWFTKTRYSVYPYTLALSFFSRLPCPRRLKQVRRMCG